ncbi:MAG: NAD-dependent epimerase/dehydratase family protein [Magnetococcales bacterium]|nr:GDP-mannose 4,6-dehydratase [Magnetococcales bacterium]NGZ05989.1 NAD-dependent epimerase/dehydratase family protein [Magnetococcales bacterium]
MKALVVGSSGQDGYYLTRQLQARGVMVFGCNRQGLFGPDGGFLGPLDVTCPESVQQVVAAWRFDRIFYLAAWHHASEESPGAVTEGMGRSWAIHCQGLIHFLDSLRVMHPTGRLFYAASSHVFGQPDFIPQNEMTPFRAITPYGITKAGGIQICRMMRARYHLFASVGILYNHESPRRGARFLTRRMVRAAVAIARGCSEELVLGDLHAQVDWGYAPEYTDAMIRILESDQPDDFIVATGRLHRVCDLAEAVFGCLGLDWRLHVREDASLLHKVHETGVLVGDWSRLQRATGWEPTTALDRLAHILVQAELERFRGGSRSQVSKD